MSKKRNWLDRISGWILDALPSEKDNKQKTGKTTTSNLERAKRKAKSQRASESGKKSNTTAIPRSQVTKQAWTKFEEEWAKLGFARDQFVSDEEVSTLIQALEKEFKDDLTEALYQLSINREAIQSLRDILNRGKVAVGDNLTAIRSYATGWQPPGVMLRADGHQALCYGPTATRPYATGRHPPGLMLRADSHQALCYGPPATRPYATGRQPPGLMLRADSHQALC